MPSAVAVDRPPPPLRRRPVPRPEPRPARRVLPVRSEPSRGQVGVPLQASLHLHPPVAPSDRPGAEPAGHELRPGSSRTDGATAPDPARWTAQFVRAAVEVADGLRSPAQLLRWTSPDVYATLARRNALAARLARNRHTGAGTRVVRSVHLRAGADGGYEAAVVISDRTRVGAVALRLSATAPAGG